MKRKNDYWEPKISYKKKKKKLEIKIKYGSKGYTYNDKASQEETQTALITMAKQTNKDFLKKRV